MSPMTECRCPAGSRRVGVGAAHRLPGPGDLDAQWRLGVPVTGLDPAGSGSASPTVWRSGSMSSWIVPSETVASTTTVGHGEPSVAVVSVRVMSQEVSCASRGTVTLDGPEPPLR
jgi:hypothetical protein